MVPPWAYRIFLLLPRLQLHPGCTWCTIHGAQGAGGGNRIELLQLPCLAVAAVDPRAINKAVEDIHKISMDLSHMISTYIMTQWVTNSNNHPSNVTLPKMRDSSRLRLFNHQQPLYRSPFHATRSPTSILAFWLAAKPARLRSFWKDTQLAVGHVDASPLQNAFHNHAGGARGAFHMLREQPMAVNNVPTDQWDLVSQRQEPTSSNNQLVLQSLIVLNLNPRVALRTSSDLFEPGTSLVPDYLAEQIPQLIYFSITKCIIIFSEHQRTALIGSKSSASKFTLLVELVS